ncbi:hypothetical protein CRM22_003432 [Opisthorchis felineus]|uniref:Uncharacterized protein n=1 Tax=Opisthorchis felineus TaxID=147828 RepID=A0A4S2M169_OPIFE|nr:hypothetical protein CRM22_003432 [Opisthorchis felineus]
MKIYWENAVTESSQVHPRRLSKRYERLYPGRPIKYDRIRCLPLFSGKECIICLSPGYVSHSLSSSMGRGSALVLDKHSRVKSKNCRTKMCIEHPKRSFTCLAAHIMQTPS